MHFLFRSSLFYRYCCHTAATLIGCRETGLDALELRESYRNDHRKEAAGPLWEELRACATLLMESIQKLKRNLVAEMRGAPGRFREAVEEVRAYWRIDDPPVRLPPESEDILLPPELGKPGDLSALRVVWSNHPLLHPVSLGSRRRQGDVKTWPTSQREIYRNLKRRWELDLRNALRRGGVPEEYLEDRAHISEDELPLYRFAAACVLYEPPDTALIAFANYGGAPPIKGWLTQR